MGRKNENKKKLTFSIDDEILHPFKIKVEDDQYVVYREGSVIAMGYYTNFANAIRDISHFKTIDTLAGEKVSLSEFIEIYQQVVEIIMSKIGDIRIHGN